MDLEDLDKLVDDVDRRGFRARFLDPMAPDPTEYLYLPAIDKDGVKEVDTVELLSKINKVAKVRKWVDVVIVDEGLEPVTGNSLAYVPGAKINNDHLSVEQILATARTNIPLAERGKSPHDTFDKEDNFDKLCEATATRHGVSLARLRRLAIQEDIDGIENVATALNEIAESIKSNAG